MACHADLVSILIAPVRLFFLEAIQVTTKKEIPNRINMNTKFFIHSN